MLQHMEERVNHWELVATDAEDAWQRAHQSDVAGRRLGLQQAQHLVQYSNREQEAAQAAVVRLRLSEESAEKMMQTAGAHLSRQSQELQEAVAMRDTFTEERVVAERKFAATLSGATAATEEVRA